MIYLFLFVLGLIMGSFYTVVGLRRPLNESIVTPPSHCENCSHRLKWYELIPILSYIFQKGKCRYCEEKIGIIYPLIELLTGILFLLSYVFFGFSYNCLIMLFIASLLIIIFVSDFKYYIILDGPLIIFGFLILITQYLQYGFDKLLYFIISGLGLFIVMGLIKFCGNIVFKRESLGDGDLKLAIILGITLGFKLGLVALISSSFLALPFACITLLKQKGDEIPLGPFLISALLIVFVFAEPILKILEYFYL